MDEVKRLFCACPSPCEGTFTLTFRGRTTTALHPETTVDELTSALEALPSIGRVSAVSASGAEGVCGEHATATDITFLTEGGDLPPLRIGNDLQSDDGLVLNTTDSECFAAQCCFGIMCDTHTHTHTHMYMHGYSQ